MATGIIYLAKNKITSKCYVGQTTRTLKIRKKQHLKETIKGTFKFARALKKYPEDYWDWSVLEIVDTDKLNASEVFYIEKFDSWKSGYNTVNGGDWATGGNPNKNHNIYQAWSPLTGTITGTTSELIQVDPCFATHMNEFTKGVRLSLGDFVLPENKDKYNEIFNIRDFYHPTFGIVSTTVIKLCRDYPQYFHNKESKLYNLVNGRCLICQEWVLAENKDRYEELSDKSKLLTLEHKDHGVLTMKRTQWKKQFKLLDSEMTNLSKGKKVTAKGWRLSKST